MKWEPGKIWSQVGGARLCIYCCSTHVISAMCNVNVPIWPLRVGQCTSCQHIYSRLVPLLTVIAPPRRLFHIIFRCREKMLANTIFAALALVVLPISTNPLVDQAAQYAPIDLETLSRNATMAGSDYRYRWCLSPFPIYSFSNQTKITTVIAITRTSLQKPIHQALREAFPERSA